MKTGNTDKNRSALAAQAERSAKISERFFIQNKQAIVSMLIFTF
jgi:hypothetical protein